MDQRLHHRMRGELELEMRWVHVDGVEAATEKPTMISSFVSVAQQYRDRDVAKKVRHSTLAPPSTLSSLCASCIAPPPPQLEEEREAAREKEAQRMKEISEVVLRTGEYQVQVHVLEVRMSSMKSQFLRQLCS